MNIWCVVDILPLQFATSNPKSHSFFPRYSEQCITWFIYLLPYSSNSSKANKIIDEYISDLSIGIGNLINIFEPETISIGGSFANFKDIFLDKLKTKLLEEGKLFNKKLPNIVMAKLKNDAGIIGSVIEYKV